MQTNYDMQTINLILLYEGTQWEMCQLEDQIWNKLKYKFDISEVMTYNISSRVYKIYTTENKYRRNIKLTEQSQDN